MESTATNVMPASILLPAIAASLAERAESGESVQDVPATAGAAVEDTRSVVVDDIEPNAKDFELTEAELVTIRERTAGVVWPIDEPMKLNFRRMIHPLSAELEAMRVEHWRSGNGMLDVIRSIVLHGDREWLHLSIQHAQRLPNGSEITMCKGAFMGLERSALVFLPSSLLPNMRKRRFRLELWAPSSPTVVPIPLLPDFHSTL